MHRAYWETGSLNVEWNYCQGEGSRSCTRDRGHIQALCWLWNQTPPSGECKNPTEALMPMLGTTEIPRVTKRKQRNRGLVVNVVCCDWTSVQDMSCSSSTST